MDDAPLVRKMYARALRGLGYTFELAVDGAEAVATFERAREAGRPFDAAIVDLTLPGGMGGVEILEALRAIDPDLRAIVASGYSDSDVLTRHREVGFRGMLRKPFPDRGTLSGPGGSPRANSTGERHRGRPWNARKTDSQQCIRAASARPYRPAPATPHFTLGAGLSDPASTNVAVKTGRPRTRPARFS